MGHRRHGGHLGALADRFPLYYLVNSIVESLPDHLSRILQPYVFVGPAVGILISYLALPVVRTFRLSLLDRNSQAFVGLENYIAVFTERQMRQAFLNNIAWILVGATLGSFRLDRCSARRPQYLGALRQSGRSSCPWQSRWVGAAIIWQFMYIYRDTAPRRSGWSMQLWWRLAVSHTLVATPPGLSTISFLIAIVVSLRAGYAMTLFSAAIKGIPADLMEAARVDSADGMASAQKDHAATDSGHAHYRGDHCRNLHPEDLRCESA